MGDFLNFPAHILGKASGSNSARDDQSCTKRARHDRGISASSSMGVLALPDGNWAANVYVDNNWTCIGTFETEKEAVIAFESTTIKIWMDSTNRYLERISNGEEEPLTLEQASVDSTHSSSSVNIFEVHSKHECMRTYLFDKVLTSRDMCRLVIPRMFAGCFPCISDEDESSSGMQPANNVELAFNDMSMTLWKFQYSYLKRTKTYSFSEGWEIFVKERDLKLNDKVIFFKCEHFEAASIVDTHFMIDVEYDPNRVQLEEVGDMGDYAVSRHSDKVQNLQNEENGGGSADFRHARKKGVDKDLEGAGSGKAAKTGFKLFGVQIA